MQTTLTTEQIKSLEDKIYECEICGWEGKIEETIHRSDSSDSGFYDYHGCPKCDNVIIDNLSK